MTSPEVKTSRLRKYVKRTAIGVAVLFAILVIALIVDISNDPKSTTQVEADKPTAQQVEQYNIEVTNAIVKKVDGKYRYFFDIRNKDTKDFDGSIKIQLVTGDNVKLSSDTFTTDRPLKPNLGITRYVEANTGPTATNGETGYTKFIFELRQNNQIVGTGEGAITGKYENLSQ